MDTYLIPVAAFVCALTGVAVVTDVRSLRIPNWLTVTGFVLGIAFHFGTQGLQGLWFSLGGFAVGFGLLMLLWLIGGAGGGDVKLLGAVGAWCGPTVTLVTFLLSTVFALISLAAMVMYQSIVRGSRTGSTNNGTAEGSNESIVKVSRRRIPYAVPAALATWSVIFMKLMAR